MKHTEPRPPTDRHVRKGGYDLDTEKKVATALWKPVGGFCLVAALALWAAMSSEKVGPGVLSFIGQNPFAITLFGIPALSGGLIALSLIGVAHAKAAHGASRWSARIPPIVDDLAKSTLGFRANLVILLGFLVLPWVTLAMANAKFFAGTYYYARDVSKGCEDKKDCDTMGSGWEHFHARRGWSLTNTPYRYEGNKTYLPIVYPIVLLALSICASVVSIRYLVLLLIEARNSTTSS